MLTGRFDRALVFASGLHRHQVRKGTGTPYLSHLLAVAALVLEYEGGEDEAIAALLHDAVEDCGDEYAGGRAELRETIRREFGERVLAIVNSCTDDDRYPKSAPAADTSERWRQRKSAYLEHLRHADAGSRLVSCADKLHNARSVLAAYRAQGERTWQRFRTRNKHDQLWYYTQLCAVFAAAGTGPLADELCRAVAELEREIAAAAPAAR